MCPLGSEWSPSSCGRAGGGGGGKAAGNKMPKSRVGLVQGRVPQGTWRGQRPAFLVHTDSLNHSFNQQKFIEHSYMPGTVLHREKNNVICSHGSYSPLRKGDVNYKNIQLIMAMSV